MKNSSGIAQLFLRLALGIGFLLPVIDRLGALGTAILTLGFGIMMGIFLSISAPFTYPVFISRGRALSFQGSAIINGV